MRARFDDLVAGCAFELEEQDEIFVCERAEEMPALLREVDAAVARGRYAAGFVGYEAAPGFDAALSVRVVDPSRATPLACFATYRRRREVEPVKAPERPPRTKWQAEFGAGEHRRAVEYLQRQIEAGWSYQVNLTTRLRCSYSDDPFLLYRQLASAQQGAYNAYLETERWAVACASPELFFSMADGILTSKPMKGTAARGRFPEEDEALAEQLCASPKERAENLMIVDLIRNDLGRLAAYGSVEVPELFALERYPTLWQLTSTVSARVDRVGIAPVFGALFPCGSVTGAPKVASMALISEVEHSARGAYCGAVGVVLPGASSPVARFAVAIRTAEVDRLSETACYGVGGGITYDSAAELEWREVETKAAVLSYRSHRLGLLETFRYEEGAGFVNLGRHLDRLESSAAHFAIPLCREELLRELEAMRPRLGASMRIRLRLLHGGALEIGLEELTLAPASPIRLALDLEQVDQDDPLLFHKTTDRSRYDAALARHDGADDVVLQNRRGEVTETTRANLAVLIDGSWRTPPLSCGLLPGIERARLLEDGTLTERVITVGELRRSEALATVSSLRGWREARLEVPPGASPLRLSARLR